MNLFSIDKPNNVYVIIETKPYNVISVVKSYDLALKYIGPDREIVGPLPLVGNDFPVKSFDFKDTIPVNFINNKLELPALSKFKFNNDLQTTNMDLSE